MRREELTFEAVDDLVAAHSRGKLGRAAQDRQFAPTMLGPLFELLFEGTNGRFGPMLASRWLDAVAQHDLRAALLGKGDLWLDANRRRGFLRTTINPLDSAGDDQRAMFLVAARVAGEAAGLATHLAQTLSAALREMESNIFEHSERPESGILAFQVRGRTFEFVAADAGIGVLNTLRGAKEFQNLSDHGQALHLALRENVSRHGRSPDHGNGFRDLFLGLAQLNADVRFRSGDHALTISGPQADLKAIRLAQKSHFQGLFASVRCHALGSAVLH